MTENVISYCDSFHRPHNIVCFNLSAMVFQIAEIGIHFLFSASTSCFQSKRGDLVTHFRPYREWSESCICFILSVMISKICVHFLTWRSKANIVIHFLYCHKHHNHWIYFYHFIYPQNIVRFYLFIFLLCNESSLHICKAIARPALPFGSIYLWYF